MFGDNVISPIESHLDGQMLAVQEIFATIQGEGPAAGTPAVFIRLAGCHLACWFCDTEFDTGIGNVISVREIAERVYAIERESRLVVITGGEPFRQQLLPLMRALWNIGMDVQIETSGTLWQEWMLDGPYSGYFDIVVSPKTGRVHPGIVDSAVAWKYIVRADEMSDEDGLPLFSTQKRGFRKKLARPPAGMDPRKVFLQPCDEHDAAKTAHNLTSAAGACLTFGYRLSVQQHKLVNLP